MRYIDVLHKMAAEEPQATTGATTEEAEPNVPVYEQLSQASTVPGWRPTRDQVRQIQAGAKARNMVGSEELERPGVEKNINGMGGDSNTALRRLANWWYPNSIFASAIHDASYAKGGTEQDRSKADDALLANL